MEIREIFRGLFSGEQTDYSISEDGRQAFAENSTLNGKRSEQEKGK